MTPPDLPLNDMREAAEKATPGPWDEDRATNLRTYGISHRNVGGYRCPIINWHGVSRPASPEGAANAAHIALWNPANALALLDRLEKAEGLADYAVHDDDCTVNRYPDHEACSCGLRSKLQAVRHARASLNGEAG